MPPITRMEDSSFTSFSQYKTEVAESGECYHQRNRSSENTHCRSWAASYSWNLKKAIEIKVTTQCYAYNKVSLLFYTKEKKKKKER